jgi:signal transduction histidine kinase/ligand-binding sensor domain-containing protein
MRVKVKYLLLFLFIASANYSPAQTIGPQYNFKQLNVQNGLAQNIVYHFLQDSKGYIWLGTHNGLTMYDGVKAVSFMHDEQKTNSLASNFITRILEDSAHQVWIGNEKGIDLFNRNYNTFSHYGVDRPGGEKDNTYCVPMAFVSPGEFWFIDTKTKSIRAFNTKTKSTQFICEMNEVDGTIYKDSQTNIIHFWSYQSIGTIHLAFKGHNLIKEQSFFSGSSNSFTNPLHVVHVLQQNDSIAWLSTNEGLICLNAITNTYKVYDHWNGEAVKELRYAAFAANGILWIGSGPSGIYTFDTKKRAFISNYKNDRADPFSICSNNIVSIYFDKSGNVWCGSYGSGASYAGLENIFFTKHMIAANESTNSFLWMDFDKNENCWCIIEDQDGFWVFDKTFEHGKHIVPLQEHGKIFDGSVYKLIFDDNKNAWCVTNSGLYVYKIISNKMEVVTYPHLSEAHFGSTWLKDMIRLHDGSVIFSTFAGLYRVKKENERSVVTLYSKLNEIYDKSFDALFQDEAENIYIKGDDSLFILNPAKSYDEPQQTKAILFAPEIYQYFSDSIQNLIYLATSEGLYILDKKNYTLKKQNIIEHMPFQSVSSVFEKDNKFWLFGEKGLFYFDANNKQERTFTIEDGLPGNEFNVSAILFSPNGSCVAGSTNGMVSFNPAEFVKNLYPPRAQLDHIYINDTLFNATANTNEKNIIKLTHHQNTFAFDFSSIAFQHNKECSYEYKLDGYDKDWIKSGAAHYTRYSNIPPGEYEFEIRVYDINSVLSPFSKTLQIQIAKAYWQTNLFQVALLVLVLCAGWLMLKWYLTAKIRKQKIIFEKQQAVEQERTRIAMEMHDDLGSGLTAIRYLAGSLSMQSSSEISDKANKIASSAKSLVDSMNDIIWTMKSDNNSIEEVLAYIKKHAAEQLETSGINSRFDFPEIIPDIKLTSEQKRNLLLISKEAIHNCIKHSFATDVAVIAKMNEHSLQLKISDNGKGVNTEKTPQFGNGLKNMNRRATEMNAQLNILNGDGTIIIVTLPFGR